MDVWAPVTTKVALGHVEVFPVGGVGTPPSEDIDPHPASDAPPTSTPSTAKSPLRAQIVAILCLIDATRAGSGLGLNLPAAAGVFFPRVADCLPAIAVMMAV